MNKNRKKITKQYSKEIKEELMNNSIVLSFALCIIIIGIFSLFFTTNNSLLVGIALSTILLTIIQCFDNKNTILNIFPLLIMLFFGFFNESIEKVPVLKELLNDNICHLIIFISFGCMYITRSYINIKQKYKERKQTNETKQEQNKIISSHLKTIQNISDKTKLIEEIIKENNINIKELNDVTDELTKYAETEEFVSSVKSTLITKGREKQKESFDIEEIEESIMLYQGLKRERKINALVDEEELEEYEIDVEETNKEEEKEDLNHQIEE